MFVFACACTHTSINTHKQAHAHGTMQQPDLYLYIYIYIYVYIYTHTHTHAYIHARIVLCCSSHLSIYMQKYAHVHAHTQGTMQLTELYKHIHVQIRIHAPTQRKTWCSWSSFIYRYTYTRHDEAARALHTKPQGALCCSMCMWRVCACMYARIHYADHQRIQYAVQRM